MDNEKERCDKEEEEETGETVINLNFSAIRPYFITKS